MPVPIPKSLKAVFISYYNLKVTFGDVLEGMDAVISNYFFRILDSYQPFSFIRVMHICVSKGFNPNI